MRTTSTTTGTIATSTTTIGAGNTPARTDIATAAANGVIYTVMCQSYNEITGNNNYIKTLRYVSPVCDVGPGLPHASFR